MKNLDKNYNIYRINTSTFPQPITWNSWHDTEWAQNQPKFPKFFRKSVPLQCCLAYAGIWFSLEIIFLSTDRIVDSEKTPIQCILSSFSENSKKPAPLKQQTICNIFEIKHKLKHKVCETFMNIHNTFRRRTRHAS